MIFEGDINKLDGVIHHRAHDEEDLFCFMGFGRIYRGLLG